MTLTREILKNLESTRQFLNKQGGFWIHKKNKRNLLDFLISVKDKNMLHSVIKGYETQKQNK